MRRRQTMGGRETSFYCLPFLLLDWFVGGTASQDPIRQSTNPCRVTWQRDDGNAPHTRGRESEQPCTYAAHAKKFFSNSKKKSSHHSSSSSEQILCVFPREKCLSTRTSPLRAERTTLLNRAEALFMELYTIFTKPTAPSPIPGCFSLTKAYFVSRVSLSLTQTTPHGSHLIYKAIMNKMPYHCPQQAVGRGLDWERKSGSPYSP